MDFSFQLYSARNHQPYGEVIERLSALGYRQVEGFGDVYEDAESFRAVMDGAGMTMPTGHFGPDLLTEDFDRAMAIAGTLGVETIVCPYIDAGQRPRNAAGWKAFAARLERLAKDCAASGFEFAWHNHDFEFAALADGQVPMELLLAGAPSMNWEMDVAWAVRGGADPMRWIESHGSRIIAAHVKDIAPEGDCADEDGWADVGHGTLPWGDLMAALRSGTAAEVFAVEHDNPKDLDRFARRSIAYLESL